MFDLRKYAFLLSFFVSISICKEGIGQKVAVTGVDKATYYVSLGGGGATNRWANYLDAFKPNSQFTGEVGYLWNPLFKKSTNAPVFVGTQLGYLGLGTDPVRSVLLGNFSQQHHAFWLHGSARYRPIVWASKWNPFVDVSGGATLYTSGVYESLSESIVRIDGVRSSAFSYQAGVGIGRIIPRKIGASPYLDLVISTFQTEPIRTAAREGASIAGDGTITISRRRIPISYVRITLSLSNFW